MKEIEAVKEYIDRLMKVVNQLTLLGEEIPEIKIVEQVLMILLEKFKAKISSLEDSKDMTKMTISQLSNSLQAVEQKKTLRDGVSIVEEAFFTSQKRRHEVTSNATKKHLTKKENKEVYDNK